MEINTNTAVTVATFATSMRAASLIEDLAAVGLNKNMKETWSIAVASELAVVGYNPEAADLDCPNGEIVGERFFLQATNTRGDRRSYRWYETVVAAEADIPEAPPVVSDAWTDDRPEYGSQAYVEYGADDDIESERRMQEAENWGFDTRYMRF